MYRIGFGHTSKGPYILTPDNHYIKINTQCKLHRGFYNLMIAGENMVNNIREFTVKDIDLINDFEFTKNEKAKEHARKAVEQCLMK